MRRLHHVVAALGMLVLQPAVVAHAQTAPQALEIVPLADHHMHIQSARAARPYNTRAHPEQTLAEVPAGAVIRARESGFVHKAAALSLPCNTDKFHRYRGSASGPKCPKLWGLVYRAQIPLRLHLPTPDDRFRW